MRLGRFSVTVRVYKTIAAAPTRPAFSPSAAVTIGTGHAPPDTLVERYAARLGDRLPGHPGASYLPELRDLAGRAVPLDRGPVHRVDTSGAVDIDRLLSALAAAWPERTG